MGEERYVKQIISDVMEMAAKIKFLEAKVAASESWSAECTDDHKRELAAALRRAKAEVLELAARELCMYCNDPGNWAPMSNSGYHQCNAPGPNMTRCYATKIHALRREIDARAAQIEEGE